MGTPLSVYKSPVNCRPSLTQPYPKNKPCFVAQTGMQALARGGTFVLVGMGTEACDCFPSMTLVSKEADVKGCFRYTNTVGLPAGVKLLAWQCI